MLVAVGDNLIHDVIYRQAQDRAEEGGFDFSPAYRQIAPIVGAADFAFINQETLLAGDELPLSSYPCFCSPTQLAHRHQHCPVRLWSRLWGGFRRG